MDKQMEDLHREYTLKKQALENREKSAVERLNNHREVSARGEKRSFLVSPRLYIFIVSPRLYMLLKLYTNVLCLL